MKTYSSCWRIRMSARPLRKGILQRGHRASPMSILALMQLKWYSWAQGPSQLTPGSSHTLQIISCWSLSVFFSLPMIWFLSDKTSPVPLEYVLRICFEGLRSFLYTKNATMAATIRTRAMISAIAHPWSPFSAPMHFNYDALHYYSSPQLQ